MMYWSATGKVGRLCHICPEAGLPFTMAQTGQGRQEECWAKLILVWPEGPSVAFRLAAQATLADRQAQMQT